MKKPKTPRELAPESQFSPEEAAQLKAIVDEAVAKEDPVKRKKAFAALMEKSREYSRKQEETIARIWTQHRKNEEQRKADIIALLADKDIGPHIDIGSPIVVAELEKHGVQWTETSTGICKKQTLSTNGALDGPAAKVFFTVPSFEDRLVERTEKALFAVLIAIFKGMRPDTRSDGTNPECRAR